MASLRKNIIVSFSVCLGIFLIFVSAIIIPGLNAALRGWYKASEEKYTAGIVKNLETRLENSNNLSDSQVADSVSQLLNENFSVIIIDTKGKIVFSHNINRPLLNDREIIENTGTQRRNKRDNFPPKPETARQDIRGMHHNFPPPPPGPARFQYNFIENSAPVFLNGEPKFYIWTKSLQFSKDNMINQKLIRSVIFTLGLGIICSVIAAMIFTSVISGKISKDASNLSEGLEKLASGDRNVDFPESNLNEISSLGKSAQILQNQLIKEENARKQWTQDIAHDLRTPTTAIKAQLEAMHDKVLEPDQPRLARLLKEIARLEVLIEDINQLTVYESPQYKLNCAEIPSEELALILKERFSLQAKEKDIELQFKVEDFHLFADKTPIIRTLSNIVQNAVQYSPQSSVIKVEFSKSENSAVIKIFNEGTIPEHEIEKIFERLYRGEFSRSSNGSGLGLTIAKAVVEKHQGCLIAENKAINNKNYIVFTVILPLDQQLSAI